MHLVGKRLIGDKVFVRLKHRKYDLMFYFTSKEEATKYYSNLDYKNQKLFKSRIKVFFCRHVNEYELGINSKLGHYVCCSKCNRALYINDETQADKEKRMSEFKRTIKEDEIIKLEKEIKFKHERLNELKREYAEIYQESDKDDN